MNDNMIEILLGQDVAAYAVVHAPAETPMDELVNLARQALNTGRLEGREVQFDADWCNTRRGRIVQILDPRGREIMANRPLEGPWQRIDEMHPPDGRPILVGWEKGVSAGQGAWNVYFNAVIREVDDAGTETWLEYLSLIPLGWQAEDRPSHWRHFPTMP